MAHVWHADGWSATERRPPSARSAWFGLGLALACTGAYAVSLLLPYYANGLQGSSQEELWAHHLAETWPYETVLGVPIWLAGMLGIAVGPFVAAGTSWWSARVLWVHRGQLPPRVRAVVVATLLVSVATLAWLPTPLAGQLVSWFVD